MRGGISRFGTAIVWAVAVGMAMRDPAACGPWVSALALPVAVAGLSWRQGEVWPVVVYSQLLCVWLILKGAPAWRFAGPMMIFIALALLCFNRDRYFRLSARRLAEKEEILRRKIKTQQEGQNARRLALQEKESSILEIGELYQLSKRFIATLDWEQARQIAEEALARWIPTLRGEEKVRYLRRLHELVDGGQVSVEALIQAMPLAGTGFPSRDRWSIVSGQLALGLQRVALYAQVQELATHDGLTGLLVRRTFRERLQEEVERALRRSTPVTFLMVDLDHFKQVNDTYGHLVGDVVLREVATLIHGSVREMDLVGRYGGEEFGVLLPAADRELGIQIAERIRRTVELAPIRAYDEEIHMTVSVGLALCPAQASVAEELVEKADQAMYRAKEMGRNRTVLWE